ncbi:MAG: hypothetical protein Q9202_006066 [Teloschistes flavicans]
MKSTYLITVSIAIAAIHAQSLLDATAPYPQLSDFNQLLSGFPDVAASLITNVSSLLSKQTILVPSNGAFDNYRRQTNSNISSLSSSDIGNILNYHSLQGALSSSDIQQPGGLISSTALTDPLYANREVLANGGQPPQNAAKGLTCVCPNDEGFAAMGDLAHSNGNLTDGPGSLLATVTRHGLTGSFYTTNFTDGALIHSQNGYPILVTRRNGSIFLNDAQIVGTNFIANTGCVHALDRVRPRSPHDQSIGPDWECLHKGSNADYGLSEHHHKYHDPCKCFHLQQHVQHPKPNPSTHDFNRKWRRDPND